MVYITGDCHGDFERITEFCEDACTTSEEDILVILGDAGINYFGDPNDRELKAQLAELPITLLCIHGNHEQRPETINTYEEVEWEGGIVYVEQEYPNLLFAKDGEIYNLDNRRCIAIGGAYSVDKFSRTPYVNWWPDEQPSDEIMAQVETRLAEEHWCVDTVFSHTCPQKYIPREEFLPNINQAAVDRSTEEWLDSIEDRLTYDIWYCGHWHADKRDGNVVFMFEDYRELF